MKVLMINVVCGIRSTGRICTDLATVLENKGYEVKIAYGRENVPVQFQKYAVKIGNEFDVKVHGLKARLFDGAGFGSRNVTYRFIKWIEEYNPDVIHLHNIHGYYINIEVLFNYLRNCGKKIIWTLHDCWAFTGHSAYCDSVNCMKWKNGCYDCPKMTDYPKALFDNSKRNWIRKRMCFTGIPNMTLITPSNWLAKLVEESFLNEYPVKVIHNGIDTEQFRPLPNDFRIHYNLENKFILLGVATAWDEMKGYKDFITLADKLDETYQVVLVGLTEQQINSLPKNILGIKRTASVKELSYIYSEADLFLNLSYCENYPTVNLEARACGTRVLTYDTGGSKESAGNDAIIVNKGDIQGVITQIEKLKKNNTELHPQEEKWNTTKIYVNPTYEDNYPTTNLEAISCGTPVITYLTGGSPESACLYGTAVEKGKVIEILNKKDFTFARVNENIDCAAMLQSYMNYY